MRRTTLVAIGMLCYAGSTTIARGEQKDSLQMVALQEVEVVSTRATAKTPVAFTNVSKEEITKQNFGQDIPFLLTTTPSVLITSDAGNGIGYTTIRVRGTDATRINITTNDIPMNDAESHGAFWVNMPDFASSLEDMQIQRGAGTSTNGAGAFGASINLRTQSIPAKAYAESSGSYGSFNTHKETVKIGSGLLNNHWAFDARLSNIRSDGYRDRASTKLKSYFLQAGYYASNTLVKFITFGGKEETYHAWDGISREELKTDRRKNPNGKIKDESGNLIGFYDNQIDYYKQTHYQLLLNHAFSPTWKMNVAFHYTDGEGYYEEYKNAQSLVEYTLTPYEVNGVVKAESNLIRRKQMDNGFGGGVFSLNYKAERLDATLGGGINHYDGDHFGRVIWVKSYIGELAPDHEYYRNTGRKTDGNIYAKATYDLGKGLSIYADAQYRHIKYKIKGDNDKWDDTASPESLQRLDINETFNFFNPKVGLSWQIAPNHQMYASLGVAQKEPSRNNYTNRQFNTLPSAEKLFDYELGYTYRSTRFSAGANLYFMDYTDQLVLNGKLNDIGVAMMENVKDSYRMGIELTAGYRFTDWLRWDVNATWSKNRIKNYTEYLSDYTILKEKYVELGTQTARALGTTSIAFSPSLTAGSVISFDLKGWSASLQSQYVSRQYLNNSGSRENTLDAYFVSHLHAGYTFKLRTFKEIVLGATIYNLFNEKYETNGYAMTSAIYATDSNGAKTGEATIVNNPRYYPMAGTNFMFNVTLKF